MNILSNIYDFLCKEFLNLVCNQNLLHAVLESLLLCFGILIWTLFPSVTVFDKISALICQLTASNCSFLLMGYFGPLGVWNDQSNIVVNLIESASGHVAINLMYLNMLLEESKWLSAYWLVIQNNFAWVQKNTYSWLCKLMVLLSVFEANLWRITV